MNHSNYMLLLLLAAGLLCAPAWSAQRVYLMAGQSNMMGLAHTARLPPQYRHTPSNVTFIYKGSIRPLVEGAVSAPKSALRTSCHAPTRMIITSLLSSLPLAVISSNGYPASTTTAP